jgi:hypothetical protein
MRISEVLGLSRELVEWELRQAVIAGKGSRERKVYFSEGAIEGYWPPTPSGRSRLKDGRKSWGKGEGRGSPGSWSREALAFGSRAAMEAACPMQIVEMAGFTYSMVS